MSITTILSDIGNVVATYDNPKSVSRLASVIGTPSHRVRAALFDAEPGSLTLFQEFMKGDLDRDGFRKCVCKALGMPETSKQKFEDAFGDVFTINAETAAVWRNMRELGVTITAVSNMDPIRWEWLQRLGVPQLFDHVLLSYEEGMLKPSKDFLLRALDRSGAKAEESLFVDDQEKNLPPARQLGVAVHLFTNAAPLWAEIGRMGVRLPLYAS